MAQGAARMGVKLARMPVAEDFILLARCPAALIPKTWGSVILRMIGHEEAIAKRHWWRMERI
jgi:hypothetical protein